MIATTKLKAKKIVDTATAKSKEVIERLHCGKDNESTKIMGMHMQTMGCGGDGNAWGHGGGAGKHAVGWPVYAPAALRSRLVYAPAALRSRLVYAPAALQLNLAGLGM